MCAAAATAITLHDDNTPQRGVVFIRASVSGTVDGKAFLTLPTSCGEPLTFSTKANTWEEPNAFATSRAFEAPAMTGCERLSFSPSMTLAPDTGVADSPAGLSVDVRVPQDEGLTEPERLVASNIEAAGSVTLPPGVAVNPGRASGLPRRAPWGLPPPYRAKNVMATTCRCRVKTGNRTSLRAPPTAPAHPKLGRWKSNRR